MRPEDLGDSPILVDTDVFSFVVWNRGPAAFYEPFLANRIWVLSFATVAELRYGAHKAGWGETKRTDLEGRIQLCVVLPGDNKVVDCWVELALNYKDQIGVNDLWIAACAQSQNLLSRSQQTTQRWSELAPSSGSPSSTSAMRLETASDALARGVRIVRPAFRDPGPAVAIVLAAVATSSC